MCCTATSITDPYRWLEDGDSPETIAFTAAQNAYTRSVLDGVPDRGAIHARLEQLLRIGSLSAPTPARGRYFYQRRDGTQNQPILYVREGVEGEDRVLLDPNVLDANGTTALDWYFPSDDGSLLAYGISQDGSEESVLHVLEVATGALRPDRIPDTRACDLAWLPDQSGFYYTRYPRAGEVPDGETQYHRAVYFHGLGADPAEDRLLYQPRVKEYWPGVAVSPDGRWVLVSVARTFDRTDLYLQDRIAGTPLRPVVENLPYQFEGQLTDHQLYIRTNMPANTYGLYVTDPASPDRAGWRLIVSPRPEAVLEGVLVTRDRLALSYLEQASSRLRLTDHQGGRVEEVPLAALGSLFGWGGEPDGDELFYGLSSYTLPPTIYRMDLRTGRAHPLAAGGGGCRSGAV